MPAQARFGAAAQFGAIVGTPGWFGASADFHDWRGGDNFIVRRPRRLELAVSGGVVAPVSSGSPDCFVKSFFSVACFSRNWASNVLATEMSVKVITTPSMRSSWVRYGMMR